MVCREASPWLCACSPFPAVRSFTLHRIFRPSVSFCINGPAHSTCSSGPHRRERSPPPPDITRRWVEGNTSSSPSQEGFVVVSYNILADKNASKHGDMYPNIPSMDMMWDRHKRLICEELLGWRSDIICLQEVDKYFDLLSYMEKAGYAGSYKRRTGDSMVDGCAMFWSSGRPEIAGESVEFREYSIKDNVAQLSVLEADVYCCTKKNCGWQHSCALLRARGDVKEGQIHSLLSKAHILSGKWDNIPIVLAGYFNSTPQV